MREEWFDIIKNPAYANRQRKTPKNVKARQRKKGRAAKLERNKPRIADYKARNTQRDFDVPDVGKKNLLGRIGDRFRRFKDERTLGRMRRDFDAGKQAEADRLQEQSDRLQEQSDWQDQIRIDDKRDYEQQLAASQKEMAAGTQADKDKAALAAQERDVELGARAMNRGELAALAARQQMDSNEAARLQEQADAEAESYKKVKTDLDRKRLAQQAAAKNVPAVKERNIQRQKEIDANTLKEREAYLKEVQRAKEQAAKEEQDRINREGVPLPDTGTEVTQMPLPPKPKKPFQMQTPAALSQFQQKTAKKKPLTFQQQLEARTGSPTGIIPRKPPAPQPQPQPAAKPKTGPPPPKKGTNPRYDRRQKLIEERVERERAKQNQQQQQGQKTYTPEQIAQGAALAANMQQQGQNPNMPQPQQNQPKPPPQQPNQFRGGDSPLNPKRANWQKVLQNKAGKVQI